MLVYNRLHQFICSHTKKVFHINEKSKLTVVGNSSTSENWGATQVKLCLLYLQVQYALQTFLWCITANFCRRSAVLHWQLPLYNSCQRTRKATWCEILLYLAFTLSQESLHQQGRTLPLNFATQLTFVSSQFSFMILSFTLFEFQNDCKKIQYFELLSGCIYGIWLRL